jgi:outer membrane lipoprotein-sorting protein
VKARRFRPSRVLALALALVPLATAGCAIVPPGPRQPIAPAARQVLDVLVVRWHDFTGLRTLAEIHVQRGERQQLHGVLVAKPPDSVRFEALSPMGQPLFIAIIRDGRLVAYDATTNEATIGPATAETTARAMSLPFEPADLVAVLAGHALPPHDVRGAELLPADEVGPSIELIGKVNRRRIWLDLETGVVQQFELTGGRADALIRYERAPDRELLGFDLTATLGWAASVRYRDPTFGAEVPDEVFAFTIPKSAKIQQIR